MSELVLRVGAKALIRHNDKFLLLREGAADGTQIGKYQIPGGQVEPGEEYMHALTREVKEETGLDIRPVKPIMVDGWLPTINGIKYQIIAIFYLCEADSAKVVLSHEHDDYVWITPKELMNHSVPHPVPKLFEEYERLENHEE